MSKVVKFPFNRLGLLKGVGEVSGYLKSAKRNVRHFKRVRKTLKSGIGVKTGGVPLLQRMKQQFPFGSYGTGRPGKIQIDKLKKVRKSLAKRYMTTTPATPAAKIDKVVNARGKGVRFIRRGGRIIPIKVK